MQLVSGNTEILEMQLLHHQIEGGGQTITGTWPLRARMQLQLQRFGRAGHFH